MPKKEEGLVPATVSDHYLAAALDELRSAVTVLREIRDVLTQTVTPTQPQVFDVKEPRKRH
jgi:hypothetical protein